MRFSQQMMPARKLFLKKIPHSRNCLHIKVHKIKPIPFKQKVANSTAVITEGYSYWVQHGTAQSDLRNG